MSANANGRLQQQIRTLHEVGTVAGLSDGELLRRFVERRGEGGEVAFAALVERHGPMVLRTCLGILRDGDDSMDAFQATFLVLARKGETLWIRESLGPWLHRVARRASGRLRESSVRRRAVETRAALVEKPDRDFELEALLHQEVDRLPERYRAAVVLCDLQGLTREEAAGRIGCPPGTVGSRLSRGRLQLRDRLIRRGYSPTTEWDRNPKTTVPPGLIASTASLASKFLTSRAAIPGTAAALALEVLGTMTLNHVWKIVALLAAMSITAGGVVGAAAVAGGGPSPQPPAEAQAKADDPPKEKEPEPAVPADGFISASPGNFSAVFDGSAKLEVDGTVSEYCKVQDSPAIVMIVPDLSKVAKGQVVCELDSSALKDQLANEVVAVETARTQLKNAATDREIAEIAVKEYVEGIFPGELLEASNSVELAESAITKAEERLARTEKARERLGEMTKRPTPSDLLAELEIEDRLEVARQRVDAEKKAFEVAKRKRESLEKFTKEKTVKELGRELDKFREIEADKLAVLQLAQSHETKIKKQIENCRIVAAIDGVLRYAEPRQDPLAGGKPLRIAIGSPVRESQLIFKISPFGTWMIAILGVPEDAVASFSPGLKARVQVPVVPEAEFQGVVRKVSDSPPYPDPNRSSDTKYFSTEIVLDSSQGLKPGMLAEVEVVTNRREGVVGVPFSSIVRYNDVDHLAIKTADKGIVWREVVLGMTGEGSVEIKSGLNPGDKFAADPEPLLDETQKQAIRMLKFNTPQLRTPGTGYVKVQKFVDKWMKLTGERQLKIQMRPLKISEALLKQDGFNAVDIRTYRRIRNISELGGGLR